MAEVRPTLGSIGIFPSESSSTFAEGREDVEPWDQFNVSRMCEATDDQNSFDKQPFGHEISLWSMRGEVLPGRKGSISELVRSMAPNEVRSESG